MLTLRSPDNSLRLDFALLAGGRAAAAGAPALRVTLAGRTLLGWSRLALDPSAPQWRCAAATQPLCRGNVLSCVITLAAVAGRAPSRRLTLRSANGGIALRLAARGGRQADVPAAPHFRLPRGSQVLAPDPATGSFAFHTLSGGRLAVAPGVVESAGSNGMHPPLTLIYPHGKCAALLRFDIGAAPWWLLLVGDRPCDLPPGTAIASLLGRELESPCLAQDLSVESCALSVERSPPIFQSPVSSLSAQFNSLLPFVRSPDWPRAALAPAAWPRPIATGVTAAHRLALLLVMGALPSPDGAGEMACERVRWDETLWLRGEMGEYLLLARRLGACWWVAAITARPRVLTLLLDFLTPGVRYRVQAWRDRASDGNAAALPPLLDAASKPMLQLAAAGGFLLRLDPERGPC